MGMSPNADNTSRGWLALLVGALVVVAVFVWLPKRPGPPPGPGSAVSDPLPPIGEPREELCRVIAAALDDLRLAAEGLSPRQAAACFSDSFVGDSPFDALPAFDNGLRRYERASRPDETRPVAERLEALLRDVDTISHMVVTVVDAESKGGKDCVADVEVRWQARRGTGRIHVVERFETAFSAPSWRIATMRRKSGFVALSPRPAFLDVTHAAGLERPPDISCHGCAYRTPMIQFGGVCTGDVSGDGLPDLFVPSAGCCRMFVNDGRGGFVETPSQSGVPRPGVGGLLLDADGDGDLDVFVTGVCAEPVACDGCALGLFLNSGDGTFRDVTSSAGLRRAGHAFSASAADYDHDGDLDIYVGFYGPVKHTPEGFLTYELNNDSFVAARNGEPNVLLRNNGDGTYTDVAAEARVADTGWTLACTFGDVDDDGWADLYVVNDFGSNVLYLNRQGRFEDATARLGAEAPGFGMGVARADTDGDGRLEFFVTGIHAEDGLRLADRGAEPVPAAVSDRVCKVASGNYLLRPSADGVFHNDAAAAGVDDAGWAWGCAFVDYDCDARPDLYVANGWLTARLRTDMSSAFWRLVRRRSLRDRDEGNMRRLQMELGSYLRRLYESEIPRAAVAGNLDFDRLLGSRHEFQEQTHVKQLSFSGDQQDRLWRNVGGRFEEVGGAEGAAMKVDSRGVSVADFDRDGRPDIFLHNIFHPAVILLRNEAEPAGRAVTVVLRQEGKNSFAVGARVVVSAAGKRQAREMTCGDSYLSSSAPELHFGLGGASRVERIDVRWPDGESQTWSDLPADGFVTLTRGQPAAASAPYAPRTRSTAAPALVPWRTGDAVREGFASLDGGRLDLPAAGASMTVVHLWSFRVPWACAVDVKNYPAFIEAVGKRPGARFVSVSLDADAAGIREALKGSGLPEAQVALAGDEARRLLNPDVPLLPAIVILGPDGKLILRHVGALTPEKFSDLLDRSVKP